MVIWILPFGIVLVSIFMFPATGFWRILYFLRWLLTRTHSFIIVRSLGGGGFKVPRLVLDLFWLHFDCYGSCLAQFWDRKPFLSAFECVKHQQTAADTLGGNNSFFLGLEQNLAVCNFDKTTITKTKDQRCGNGDARNNNKWGLIPPLRLRKESTVSAVSRSVTNLTNLVN